jgi:hypothetical protein
MTLAISFLAAQAEDNRSQKDRGMGKQQIAVVVDGYRAAAN